LNKKLNIKIMAATDLKTPVITSKKLFNEKTKLGEGAFWNYKTNTFWWIDIEAGLFHIYDPLTKNNKTYDVQQRIGTVVPDSGGNAIVALQDGIYRLQLNDSSLTLLAKADYDTQKFRFNDGKCDPAGRLWVGTMHLDESEPAAALYVFDKNNSLKRVMEDVTISNGIVWSIDHSKMYYIDTPTLQVKEFYYDKYSGSIKFSRIAVRISEEFGMPDGMTIDENGKLWIGHFGGHAVYCWDPDTGALLTRVEVAAKNVTSCDFGGENLDQLFITTASIDMSDQEKKEFPDSGSVFIAHPGAKGVKREFFIQ
jgi:sugar lactone lactonase YvrE